MSNESRLANASTLKYLNDKAQVLGYNRQISGDAIASLDPSGLNIVTPVMIHEHAGGERVDPHMRTRVLMKYKGVEEPNYAYLDVRFQDLEMLPSADRLLNDVQAAR